MKKILITMAIALMGVSSQALNTWTGAADTDYNAAGNWSDGNPPINAIRANDDGFFDTTATNFTPTLSADATTRNLIFNGGNYTLGGTSFLTFGGGQVIQWGSGTVDISAPIFQSGGNNLQFNGVGSGAITLSGTVDLSLGTGNPQIQKFNQSDVTLNNTVTLRTAGGGNIIVRAGRLAFSGSGALNNVAGTITLGLEQYYTPGRLIDCSGAGLLIDDTGTGIANRLGTQRSLGFGPRTLLEFRGNASAASVQTSSGLLNFVGFSGGPGQRIRIANGSGQSARLTFAGLQLGGGTNNVDQNGNGGSMLTMLVPSGSTLGAAGTAGGRLIFTTAPDTASTSGANGLLRYVVVRNEASGAVDFATYDSTVDDGVALGVRAITSYDVTNSLGLAAGTSTALITTSVTVATDGLGVNALKIAPSAGGQSLDLGANRYWIKNATGLIFQGGYDYAINGTTNLAFGTGAGASAYAYIKTNTLTINAPVLQNGEFAKAGDGLLVLNGPTHTLQVDRNFGVDKGAGGGDDVQISGAIGGGAFRIIKSGLGTLSLTGSGDNSTWTGGQFGGMNFSAGTVVLAKDSQALQNNALGQGYISFGQGTLAARGFSYTTTNLVSISQAGSQNNGATRFAGDQPLTFQGVVQGALKTTQGGQTYVIVNDATANVTMSGFLQPFSTNDAPATLRGSTFEFAGTGNTVVSGIIRDADPTWAGGANSNLNCSINKQGPGRLTLSSPNTYSGQMTVGGGFLRLDAAGALGTNSLRICQVPNWPGEEGYAVVELGTGNTSFTRKIGASGTGPVVNIGHVALQNLNNAGFASVSGTATVNLGLAGVGGIGETLTWGSGNFFGAGNTSLTGGTSNLNALILGSPGCAGTLDFQNPINLGGRDRTIIALNGSADVDGIMSGVISSANGIIKLGAGTLELSAANTYTGTTAVNAGRLLLSGSIASTNVTVASGATLDGTGTIAGPVTVAAGGTLSVGASIGTLTINNSLTLSSSSKTVVEINAATGARDQVTGLTTVAYAGTLIVATNIAGTVTNNQTFQIFSAATPNGNFSSISNQVPGVTSWAFNPASGVLTATVPSIPSTPTNITYTVSDSTLTVAWPASYIGWLLQAQTNTLNVGLSTNWVTVPGSSLVNSNVSTIIPGNPAVFYRLKHPTL
jgi:fibronectin-binding autotransporter adhesin